MLRPSTGPSQPLIALYSDALPGAKRRSRGAGSCMGAEPPHPAVANVRFQGRPNWCASTDLGRERKFNLRHYPDNHKRGPALLSMSWFAEIGVLKNEGD